MLRIHRVPRPRRTLSSRVRPTRCAVSSPQGLRFFPCRSSSSSGGGGGGGGGRGRGRGRGGRRGGGRAVVVSQETDSTKSHVLYTLPQREEERTVIVRTLRGASDEREAPHGGAAGEAGARSGLWADVEARLWRWCVLPFLPKNYPASVTPHYTPYVKWYAAQATISAASGVLSTQSLLFAIGIGASTALPAAAAMNWVIKDGLGQLGGVVFANVLNNRFDSDPKRWRLVSAYALDFATFVEVATPLFPKLFLPLASVANIGKNIAWLSASATRAGIHRSFLRAENLADVTAKSGSQAIAASLLGTALGIGISTIVGHQVQHVMPAFLALAAGHLYCNYRSLREVALPTLNVQRAEHVALGFISHVDDHAGLDAGDDTRDSERGTAMEALAAAGVMHPNDVQAVETFVRPFVSRMDEHTRLVVGPPLQQVVHSASELRDLLRTFDRERYIIKLSGDATGRRLQVLMLFLEDATGEDVLTGYLHAKKLRHEIHLREQRGASSSYSAAAGGRGDDACKNASHHLWDADDDIRAVLVAKTLRWTREHKEAYLAELRSKGWVIDHVFIEGHRARVKVVAM